MGKDKKGWLRGGNYSHATCLWEFLWVSFFIQPYFTVAFSCSSLCADSHEQNCPSVLQMVQLSLYSCHTNFILILAAWNTWLRVSSWAPCPKSEVKSRVFFFPSSDIIHLKHMHWTQENSTLYSSIKALPKKVPVCVAVFARGTVVNGYSVSF